MIRIKEALTASTSINLGSLGEFLKTRKVSSLWALWLECKDFSRFMAAAKPDRTFTLNGREAALIHMGPFTWGLVVLI